MSAFNQIISEENGQKLKAYVAKPKSGKGPGVVLMHEVYGVTDGLKEVADYLASQGFIVACPNMYWRKDSDASFKYDPPPEVMATMEEDKRNALQDELKADREAARDLMFDIVGNDDPTKGDVIDDPAHLAQRQAEVVDTINRVADFLRNHKQCTGLVASSGFCFGARNTYLALTEGANVDAGVAFYPTPKLHQVFDMDKAEAIDKPMMFVYAGQDGYVSQEEKKAMRDVAGTVIRYVPGEDKPLVLNSRDGNPSVLTLAYTANDHGFNRRHSKYSDPGASDHALAVAAEFLHSALNTKNPGFNVPDKAENEMPQSPRYVPAYKV